MPPEKEDVPPIERPTRHTVVVSYDDTDVPALNQFLGTVELPDALGTAILERIQASFTGRKPRRPARNKSARPKAPSA